MKAPCRSEMYDYRVPSHAEGNCSAVRCLLVDFLLEGLTAADDELVRQHVDTCRDCQRLLVSLGFMIERIAIGSN
jgi:hypothetical protein